MEGARLTCKLSLVWAIPKFGEPTYPIGMGYKYKKNDQPYITNTI